MINKNNLLLCLLVPIFIYGCGAGSSNSGTSTHPASCPYPIFNNQIAESLLTSWGQGLQTYNKANNPDIYVSAGDFTMTFYLPYGVLQPTLSPEQRFGTHEIYDYFVHFLSSNPVMTFNPESNVAHDLGCGFGSYAGYYNFLTNPGTASESTLEARFTFIYEYIDRRFQESFVAESGASNGQTFIQTNQPGWYVLLQQSSALPISN